MRFYPLVAGLLLCGLLAQAQTPQLDSQESAFLTLINTYRSQNGAGPLQISPALENSSTWMSNDMATKNYFSHTDSLGRDPGTRIAAFGYPYYPWGENIAAGYSDAQSTLNQWITACDPDGSGTCTYAHRQNMLNPAFVVIGIGRAAGGTYGWYWTTDFGGVLDTNQNSAPSITSFTASPSTITAGQSSTLNWSVSGATTLTLDNGIGSVTGSSSRTVSPGSTTTYTLTATNSTGSVSARATVTVQPLSGGNQPPTTPSITSAVARSATEIDLAWTASTDTLGIAGYQIIRNGTVAASVSGTTLNWADTGVTAGTTYSYVVKAFDSAGNYSAASNTVQVTTPSLSGGTTGSGFFPVAPCRAVDTRASSGMPALFGAPSLSAGQTRTFRIPFSGCGIPAGASAYSVNVTVVPATRLGYLSLWPTGQTQPVVSTLNSPDGQITANAAIVAAGSNGAISVFASDNTDVIIDINGYFVAGAPSALAFYPVTPCRVADTRSTSFGPLGSPSLGAGQTRAFAVLSSTCGIPASAQAYSLNLTAVPPGRLGYISAWPAGQAQPLVSTLNSPSGRTVANAAIVPAGGSGSIDIFASDTTDLVIDINGYFAPAGGPGALYLYPVSPCRVADTRSGSGFAAAFGPPSLIANGQRSFSIPSGGCGIPSTAQAYSLNMTAVPSGSLAYLTVWPAGQAQPFVSTLNSSNGNVVANAAIVPAGSSGAISVFAPNPTDLVIDIDGYFAP